MIYIMTAMIQKGIKKSGFTKARKENNKEHAHLKDRIKPMIFTGVKCQSQKLISNVSVIEITKNSPINMILQSKNVSVAKFKCIQTAYPK